ncbi:hypothetical protein [Streptomyces phaeochromogenes]|uniref:hypothetical protein n=1 Tax=Streptomyces phaeochromogenes TaxID=1923 RepID=UPI00398CAFB9
MDSSGRTVNAVARGLGISSKSLRGWYCRAKADRGEGESSTDVVAHSAPQVGTAEAMAGSYLHVRVQGDGLGRM